MTLSECVRELKSMQAWVARLFDPLFEINLRQAVPVLAPAGVAALRAVPLESPWELARTGAYNSCDRQTTPGNTSCKAVGGAQRSGLGCRHAATDNPKARTSLPARAARHHPRL